MAVERNLNVVHESEVQRQHVRVKLPASVRFTLDGVERRYDLYDVSAGGFSFHGGKDGYAVGQSLRGQLLLSVNGVGFSIPIKSSVSKVGATDQRVTCLFQDLGANERSALRQIITAYIGGELVTAGDMLTTLSRENFTGARNAKGAGALGATARTRALLGTGLALLLGILAFGYTVFRLYDLVVVTHAAAAKVAAPTYTITMPRDGTFFSLVNPGESVKKGQSLGSFQTALLDVVAGVPGSFKLTPQELSQMVGQQLRGSIASPCDCVVQKMLVTDGQYVIRNQTLVKLVPVDTKPYLLARFHYGDMVRLPIGRKVTFTLNGSTQTVAGRIARLRVLPAQTVDSNGYNDLNGLDTNSAITDVIAEIEPLAPLPLTRVDEPTDVRLDPLSAWLH